MVQLMPLSEPRKNISRRTTPMNAPITRYKDFTIVASFLYAWTDATMATFHIAERSSRRRKILCLIK
jgi:hypothetical protein